ncbi:helix-turn-helix domain-containing protein [Paraburkholderia largidicola]|uniref:helix-turn-helix domain-containing protein n=1 Tax=Paraburkholderia largidicola TaxID=3014751 RepID=UPI0015DB7EDD
MLLTLSCHLNDLGEDCFPSTAMLAEETGLSERSVCTHLAVAAELGWFIVRKHGYGKQKWARHEYFPRIPEGFEVPDRAEEGTEGRSVPMKKGRNKKALKDVQCPVDKGAEGGSVPSEKALNVVPEGTEPNDKKALKDVQSNTAVNPSTKAAADACENTAAAAVEKISKPETASEAELTELLIALERDRGKDLTIDRSRDRVHVLRWVADGLTADQLRSAHAAAAAARKRDTDDRPTYVGFVATFVAAVLAPDNASPTPRPGFDAAEWHLTPEGVDRRAAELNVKPRKPDEDWRYYRVLVVKASNDRRAAEFVLADATRFNALDLYQFARQTFGDALMPVDDYAS